jgi:hypothetical protein
VFRLWDEAVGEEVDRLFGQSYDLPLGRRTYDIFADYWPYNEGEAAAIGDLFAAASTYVLTGGDLPIEWENSYRLGGMANGSLLPDGHSPEGCSAALDLWR